MCAISGILSTRPPTETGYRQIDTMNEVQRHRGPDGAARWAAGPVVLGHRRLSIIDLSASGTQPMTNEDDTLALVCNGEIYNFKQLRDRLRDAGHRFRSATDIEVILHLYEEHGDDCVRHLVGMFAFALWDVRRGRLLLARDRIGEKPLYYAETQGRLSFASEVSALLTLPDVDRTLDEEALAASLIYPSTPAPLTMFKGIRALPPASCLTWERGRTAVSRYWRINCSPTRHLVEAQAVEELDALLEQAVRGALIADVPVGLLLSGGVDSSAIAFYAAKAGADVQAFSVAYDAPDRPDPDLARARTVAAQLRLPHREIPFSPLDLRRLPSIAAHYAQPFNVFPMLYADQLSSGVRRHVTVALGGNGADEAFGGYRGYNRQIVGDFLGRAGAWVPAPLIRALPVGRAQIARLHARWTQRDITERRGEGLNELARSLGSRLFTERFANRAREYRPGRFVTDYARECSPREYLDTVMYSDLMVYHQHGTTVITDVAGMTHSLEIRAPFLDHRLLEFAFSLPRRLKIRSPFNARLNKYLLKRALEPSLPREVLFGPKYGFGYNVPLEKMMTGPWKSAVDLFVRRGRYLELGIFSPQAAEWAADHAPVEAWRLLVFAIWSELYVFGEAVDAVESRLRRAIPIATVRVA
jgi:asparagine synthase (glutamine-hydrolysing)